MSKHDKKIEYDDISMIEMKKKPSTRSQNTNNHLHVKKNQNTFKFTDSDMELDNKAQVSNTPRSSNKSQSRAKERYSVFNTKMTLNQKATPDFVRKTKLVKPQIGQQKLKNINLINSIPMTLTFQKAKDKNENESVEQRKFRIFPQAQAIKFTLPPLQQYYAKPLQIKKQKQKQNQQMAVQQQSEKSSVNKHMNISASTFFGFGHNNDQKVKKGVSYDKKNLSQSNFAKTKKLESKSLFKTKQDQIRQQEEDQASYQNENQNEKHKLITLNIDYKSKGIYLLLGFLLSIIVMILIKKFT